MRSPNAKQAFDLIEVASFIASKDTSVEDRTVALTLLNKALNLPGTPNVREIWRVIKPMSNGELWTAFENAGGTNQLESGSLAELYSRLSSR